jgi:hypothetical protein
MTRFLHSRRPVAAAALFALALLVAPRVSAQENREFAGTLAAGDEQLTSGEYVDTYAFPVRAGQTITIDLVSDEVDPYIILKGPDEEQYENDDYEGSTTHSRVVQTANVSGNWDVMVTTYASGETGGYEVHVTIE